MLKLAGNSLVNLRIEGDTTITASKLRNIIQELGARKPLNVRTTAVRTYGREDFEHWVHFCTHKDPKNKDITCLHFISEFEKTKTKLRAAKPANEMYAKMLMLAQDGDLAFKARVVIAFRLPLARYTNIFGLPEEKRVKGGCVSLKGAIFEDEIVPGSSFFLEVTKKYLVFARTFHVASFFHREETINQLIAENMEVMNKFIKRR